MASLFRDNVANLFRAYPNEWIDGKQLATVGGSYGWRTRVSDCRRQLQMRIENRVRRLPHNQVKVSEYRYVPTEVGQ